MSRHPKNGETNNSYEKCFGNFNMLDIGTLPRNIGIMHPHDAVNVPVTKPDKKIGQVHYN